MAESICAPDAPPSTPTLATMAVAAGAAVLAGAMIGRKGLTGIAAGLAALAGAKWYSGTRSMKLVPVSEDTWMVVDHSPEVHPPKEECTDWLDHDAVDFSHMVPDSAEAAEMLKEKTLPLLDDDGQPVDFISVPVDSLIVDTVAVDYPDVPEAQFPLGPMIWKPGRFPQSTSAGTSETVWFGMQDVTPAPQSPALPAPAPAPLEPVASHAIAPVVITEPAPPPIPAPMIVEEAPAPPMAVPPPIPTFVGLSAITHPKQASVPAAQDPFLAPAALHDEPGPVAPSAFTTIPFSSHPEQASLPVAQNPFYAPAALHVEPAPVASSVVTTIPFSEHPWQASLPVAQNPFVAPAALHVEPAPAASSAVTAIPFSSGAFGASPVSFVAAADAAAAPVVEARPAAKSILPQRRRPGELPKHMASRVPDSDPASPATPFSDPPIPWRAGAQSAQGVLCAEPVPAPQRHLERLAPVIVEPEEKRWPLLVLLCLIIAIGVAIAVNRWHDNAVPRKVEPLSLPVLQKPAEVAPAVASPTPAVPAAATDSAKRGPWIEPAPAPLPEPVK